MDRSITQSLKDIEMQVFANTATEPVKKLSKAGKAYWEFRACESQRGQDLEPTWYVGAEVKVSHRAA